LIATFSIVARRQRGGTGPTGSAPSRPDAATIAATFSAVGGTTGRPSVQPRANSISCSSM
jgi:hypothetical protein